MEMERSQFRRDSLTLSFLDEANGREPLVALHAHWMEGATYRQLASDLELDWRVIALDQRGHGYSDHSQTYGREDYVEDIRALLDHLGLDRAVILGNSLGGANAYQFAAWYPEKTVALVIEDIGVEIHDDTSFALPWGGIFQTRQALEAKIGERLAPALAPSIRESAAGWHLAFDPCDTVASQEELNGEHWNDWVASVCPALIVRGKDSRVTDRAHLEDMAARRPNTSLIEADGGHVVHFDNPSGFAAALKPFLDSISSADETHSQ
jgi:esterase